MIVQPTIDGRAEARHPPRAPRFGRRQRDVLRILSTRVEIGIFDDCLTPAERRAAERLRDRGFVRRDGRIYFPATQEIQ